MVVPSQSNQVLNTPLHYFISQIKVCETRYDVSLAYSIFFSILQEPEGSTDGADKYPGSFLLRILSDYADVRFSLFCFPV